MQARRPRRFGALVAGLIVCAMLLSIAFIDRPVAFFMFRRFHESRAPFEGLTRFVDVLVILATLGLVWSGWNVARRRPFGRHGQIVARFALALFLATGVKEVTKLAFGRTWPETWTCNNPSFIRDGVMIFSPFHGGQGWASFPAGHEVLTCAAAACLWVLVPRFRPLYLLIVFLAGLGLLVSDYHFVSDILAGGLIGWMVGLFVARLGLPRAEALA